MGINSKRSRFSCCLVGGWGAGLLFQHKNWIKRSGQARLVYVWQTTTSQTCEGEPAGTQEDKEKEKLQCIKFSSNQQAEEGQLVIGGLPPLSTYHPCPAWMGSSSSTPSTSAALLTSHNVFDVIMILPVLVDGSTPVPPCPCLCRFQDVVLLRPWLQRPRPLAMVNWFPQSGVGGEVTWRNL